MGLRYLTIHTSREDYAFAAPEAAVPAGATLSGTITHLAVRELAEKEAPQLCVSFPAAVLATKARGPEARSMMFPPAGGLEALRKKFNAPEFADYKSVLLHNTVPGVIDTPVTPSPCERLTSLFWAYVLTDQREYYDRMLVEVDGLCGVTDKLPANRWEMPGHLRQVLDIQEFMGHNIAALAMVYDVLGDQLDQARRDRIHFVLVRAAKQYLQRIATGDWWYVSNPSNTIGVGSGTMGLAGLALRYDDPELSKKVLDAAVTTITKQYVALSADGSCIEGNLYWDYGTRYPLLLGYALRNVTGSDRGITSGNGYKNAQHYMENILGGDGKFIPFNDTQPWLTGWGMCSYAGSQFDQPFMRWMADRMAKYYAARTEFEGGATPTISAFLYRDTRLAPKDFPGVPTISVLKGVQEGVMRSDGKVFIPALVTGVKGKGASSTHHAEEDQGSFVVYSNGEPMLIDPGYFESDAQMHSLPLLGDAAKMKLETTVECPIMDAWESGVIRTMSVDATAAYNAGPNAKTPLAERVRRVVVQVGASGVVVLDDIAPKDPKAAVTSQYQTGFAATVQGERNALITGKSGTLTLRTFGPDLKLAVAPRKFSKEWIYFKANVVWQTLSGSYIVDADKPLVTVLVPALKDAAPVAASVQYTADHVDVTIGENKVRFQREAGPGSSKSVWKALKP